jgi:CheY-like chemotaxis protein
VGTFSKATILFVDDDACMREVMAMILDEEGYEVVTASDGFDALASLRANTPDLIISDLHMPRMSGFELLTIVRWRFPVIPVIAISGAHEQDESFPAAVMADAFYPKGRCHPDELLRTISQLLRSPLSRPTNYHPCRHPQVQTARSVRDMRGEPLTLLTCPECLRTFSIDRPGIPGQRETLAACSHCGTSVHFIHDQELNAVPRSIPCEQASAPAA